MHTNEPGREPEPTDAVMFPREAQIDTGWTIDYSFIHRISDRTREMEWTVGMEETECVLLAVEAELSGARPMPESGVSRAEMLKAATDTLLKAEAERMPDTPAPDEVAQLREDLLAWQHRCGLKELRIADLERENAALGAELADLKRMVCAVQPSEDHESLYCYDTVFRGVPMNWFDARDKMLSTPGKEAPDAGK